MTFIVAVLDAGLALILLVSRLSAEETRREKAAQEKVKGAALEQGN